MRFPTISELGGKVFFQRRYAEPNDEGWSSFNSSVMLSNEGEYWMAFRSSNYYFVNGHDSLCFSDNPRGAFVLNKLFLVKLNKDTWQFEEETLKQIDTKSSNPFIIRDVEDPRLFWDGENYCISATILERGFKIAKICKITLKSLDEPEVTSLDIFDSYKEKVSEKNWMPIQNTKNFIHSSYVGFFNNQFIEKDCNPLAKSFRGSSQVIPFGDNTHIAVIHEAEHYYESRQNPINFGSKVKVLSYSHRFILMNDKYDIIKISDKFVMTDKQGFDFVAGMAPTDDGYVISFGRSDVACYVATISKDNVEKTLTNLIEY